MVALAVSLVIAGGLILLSALFSGLTLGLLSLDKASLEILAEAGEDDEKRYARSIIPLRKDGNLLLCTLLIGNVIVNSYMSILLADITSGIVGLLVSTSLIVIFGEIIPQATCSRHGLVIGSYTRYITWTFVVLLYPIAKPIALVLDSVLGKEVGGFYSRDELIHLLKMQVKDKKDNDSESGIDVEDHTLLVGAPSFPAHLPLTHRTGAPPTTPRCRCAELRQQDRRGRDDKGGRCLHARHVEKAELRDDAGRLQVRLHTHPRL